MWKSITLEEIIVTAKRRNEDLQTTSISATVLHAGPAREQGRRGSLFALQYAAPAITVTQYGSANVFNIRGLGRSQVDIDVPSGVVIYRDGTPTLAGYFQNEPYFDMESVEVYRGPQGTFVGKNAAGGAVFINTNGSQARRGPDGERRAEGRLLGATREPDRQHPDRRNRSAAARATGTTSAMTSTTRSPAITPVIPGEVDNNSYRLGVLWQPSDSFSGLLKVDYHDLDFGGNPTTVYGEEPLGDVVQNANFAVHRRVDSRPCSTSSTSSTAASR